MGNSFIKPKRIIDINKKNNYGETLLMHAAFKGDLELVKRLVKRGGDVNAYNKNYITVLMFSNKNYKVVEYLLSNGITLENIFMENSKGDSIIEIAEKNQDYNLMMLLKVFVESKLDFIESYTEKCRNVFKKWDVDETDIKNFYISAHRKFILENAYKNLAYLVKMAPTFGHPLTVFTSNNFTVIDNETLECLRKGESTFYPRILKCTFDPYALFLSKKMATKPLFLIIDISDGYLFSENHVVFIAPRFLKIKKVINNDLYSLAQIQNYSKPI
jgi:hypothetical protein